MNTVDIVFSPELIEAYTDKTSLCIVIDILRASSTIITALANGAEAIYPLSDISEAETKAEEGLLVGAERNVLKCNFSAFGNDPAEYASEKVMGKSIYFTTTNGTYTIRRCLKFGHSVVIGGFININAIVRSCSGKDVLCVCAGWKGKFCVEDAFYAGAIVERLKHSHKIGSDAGRLMKEIWDRHKNEKFTFIQDSDHYERMTRAGKEDAVPYCLTEDITNTVPTATIDEAGIISLRGIRY
ncbi:2-phosphosulfolactate phosphatase [Porphyromonas sp.]|uniref:2-phosphosulfolactate phosphatase n=1 Tax=Porphyromonas sp. TaxID=1924944 RepID=UPI0026DD0B4F|nr:2-phosphosulfolactate phosphatase [Porphyromonas sp.]MDO4695337.1 2-phosphosulfolactate phosphatase [Porphyromonas sp.]MDO4771097.1 2-phosphosulfolactate phosphatase [Porphyromonas sp.]